MNASTKFEFNSVCLFTKTGRKQKCDGLMDGQPEKGINRQGIVLKPLLHIGGFCRRSAAVQKPLMKAVERHKAQTQPWVNAAERHWAPIAAVAVRKFWNVLNFRRRATVKYLSVMERGRASSIVLNCR